MVVINFVFVLIIYFVIFYVNKAYTLILNWFCVYESLLQWKTSFYLFVLVLDLRLLLIQEHKSQCLLLSLRSLRFPFTLFWGINQKEKITENVIINIDTYKLVVSCYRFSSPLAIWKLLVWFASIYKKKKVYFYVLVSFTTTTIFSKCL